MQKTVLLCVILIQRLERGSSDGEQLNLLISPKSGNDEKQLSRNNVLPQFIFMVIWCWNNHFLVTRYKQLKNIELFSGWVKQFVPQVACLYSCCLCLRVRSSVFDARCLLSEYPCRGKHHEVVKLQMQRRQKEKNNRREVAVVKCLCLVNKAVN